MTVFHLVRHGDRAQGRVLAGRMPGVGLTERGRTEIAAVAERLAGAEVAALYASPLQRTRESVEIIAARLELPIEYRDDLLELDFGDWTGLSFDAIRGDPAWRLWNSHRSIARIPGGETMRAVQHRAVEALMELQAQHPEATVAIVSHGDVIRAALCFALSIPLEFISRFEVGQGSINTLRIEPGNIRVHAINDRPHRA